MAKGIRAKTITWCAALCALIAPSVVTQFANTKRNADLTADIVENSLTVHLRRAEVVIDLAVDALRKADGHNLSRCDDAALARMRRFVLVTADIKEFSVLNADGSIACGNLGKTSDVIRLGPHFGGTDPQVLFYAVRYADNGQLGIRIASQASETRALGVIVPAEWIVPAGLSVRHAAIHGITVSLSDGPVIVNDTQASELLESDRIEVTRTSGRYPISVTVAGSRSAVVREELSLTLLSHLAAIVIGLLGATLIIIQGRRHRDDLLSEMKAALIDREFVPFYQPILDLDTGKLKGCEVLVRWRKPDGTIVSPGAFIDLAERSGFIFPLTLYLMEQAAADLGPVFRARPGLRCGFNLCAEHFRNDHIVADVTKRFTSSTLPLSQLLLEVTERDPLPDVDLARRTIAAFQGMGVRVALDDVGTGHGGMSYLLKLGVDVMKIDKLFVDAISTERYSTAIIDSLIDLAAHMRMEVVAEGVETFEQVEALRRRGVQAAQGFVFAPALPATSFRLLVESMEAVPSIKQGDVFVV